MGRFRLGRAGPRRPALGRLFRFGRFPGRFARFAREAGLPAPVRGEDLARAVKPALKILKAATATPTLLAPGAQVGSQMTQEVEHRALQLLHAVADDADVAAAFDAPRREVVAQRLLVGAEFDERLVDFIEVALVLLAGFVSALQM